MTVNCNAASRLILTLLSCTSHEISRIQQFYFHNSVNQYSRRWKIESSKHISQIRNWHKTNAMDRNKNSPRNCVYSRRTTYTYYSNKNPDFFSKKRMICGCNLEFLDAGAYAKHMKKTHPDTSLLWMWKKQNEGKLSTFPFEFYFCLISNCFE